MTKNYFVLPTCQRWTSSWTCVNKIIRSMEENAFLEIPQVPKIYIFCFPFMFSSFLFTIFFPVLPFLIFYVFCLSFCTFVVWPSPVLCLTPWSGCNLVNFASCIKPIMWQVHMYVVVDIDQCVGLVTMHYLKQVMQTL